MTAIDKVDISSYSTGGSHFVRVSEQRSSWWSMSSEDVQNRVPPSAQNKICSPDGRHRDPCLQESLDPFVPLVADTPDFLHCAFVDTSHSLQHVSRTTSLFSVNSSEVSFISYSMRRHLFLRLSARPSSLHRGLKLPRQSPAVNKFFHASSRALAVKPFLLADIGEGRWTIISINPRF
jgi:hypothetical protein